MKKTTVRAAEPHESTTYAEWLTKARDVAMVDPAVYKYPTCNTVSVETDGKLDLMNSFHLVLMAEAIAPRPGATRLENARSIKALWAALEEVAKISGVKEIWFGSSHEPMQKFAKENGIEEVPFKVYRKRLK